MLQFQRKNDMPIHPVKSAERIIRILELFKEERRPHSLHAVATKLGIPSPSALALLKTLVGTGYLIFDLQNRTYFPSLRLASLGDWVTPSFFENSSVLKVAQQLRSETAKHVVVSLQSDIYVHYVCVIHAEEKWQYGTQEGGLWPLVKSCSGITMLSAMPDRSIDRICKRSNAANGTKSERVDSEKIIELAHKFRQQGYGSLVENAHPELINLSMLLPPTATGKRFAITVHGTAAPRQYGALVKKMYEAIAAA